MCRDLPGCGIAEHRAGVRIDPHGSGAEFHGGAKHRPMHAAHPASADLASLLWTAHIAPVRKADHPAKMRITQSDANVTIFTGEGTEKNPIIIKKTGSII